MPLQPGTILENRYRVDSLLGQGGMGAVYRAWHERLEQWVAIKENSLVTPEARAQFEREAKVLARLHHTNLPNVIDHFVTADGAQYLVMTFVEGVNLAELLAARGKQSPADVMMWLGQVCDALTYLHSQNPPIIHRDIKPQNIKITPDGHVFLVDFGLSKVGSTYQSTLSGALGATPGYAPLEQYGSAHTDQRSDVYALTATLYAMLTGETPPESVKRAVGTAALTPPRTMNLTVSPALERALLHGLETQPTNRPGSVAALRREVEAALGAPRAAKPVLQPPVTPPTQAIPRPSPVPRAAPSPARRERGLPGWTLVGMGALVVVLLVLGVAAVGRGGQPTAATVVAGKPTITPRPEGTVKPKATVAVIATRLPPKDTDTPTPISTMPPMLTPVPSDTLTLTAVPSDTLTPTAVPSDTPMPSDTPTAFPDAIVNSATVNLRAGPGTAYDRLGAYPQGTPLKVVGKNGADDWIMLETADGKTGWMVKNLLRVNIALDQVPVAAAPPTPTRLPVPASDMVFVQAGDFLMGTRDKHNGVIRIDWNNEDYQHVVTLDSFWIDRTEVTNAQYRKCVQAGPCRPPAQGVYSRGDYPYENSYYDSHPVTGITWSDAVGYCTWVGQRLPTEAEWEKAARGADGREWPWGNDYPDCSKVNMGPVSRNDASCNEGDTSPVGSYPAGASPYGVLDMAGNVTEWVADWYDESYYQHSPRYNPTGPRSGTQKVTRGGGFNWSDGVREARAAGRHPRSPDNFDGSTGFRCVRPG